MLPNNDTPPSQQGRPPMSDHPITTTLTRIRAHGPCKDGWEKLLKHLGKTRADDEPLPYATILKSNGLDDALWCCRAEPQYATEWRLFAVWCVRQVQYLMTDTRSINAIDVAERFANGLATDDELDAARVAAWSAAQDAAGLPHGVSQGLPHGVSHGKPHGLRTLPNGTQTQQRIK